MKETNWQEAIDYIEAVLLIVSEKLDRDAVQAINSYLEHDEYEMSFEILFIEIMALNDIPRIDFEKGLYIGKMLRLNEESVFDADFWGISKRMLEKVLVNRGAPVPAT